MTLQNNLIHENEILNQKDLQFGFDSNISNMANLLHQFLNGKRYNYVIGGKVTPYVSGGMNVSIAPLMAFEYKSSQVVLETGITEPIAFEEADENKSRIDIIEIKSKVEPFDMVKRAFKDNKTGKKSFSDVYTKQRIALEVKVKRGENGCEKASPTDIGFVKIAEVVIPAGTLNITEDLIKNVTARAAGNENLEWTENITDTFFPCTAVEDAKYQLSDFSIEGTATGVKWFDGKDIYNRIIVFNAGDLVPVEMKDLSTCIYCLNDFDVANYENCWVDVNKSCINLADGVKRRFYAGYAEDGKLMLEAPAIGIEDMNGMIVLDYTQIVVPELEEGYSQNEALKDPDASIIEEIEIEEEENW